MLLGLVALSGLASAADVLIVEATPATLEDFSLAFMVYDLVVTAAREEGLDFEDADAVRVWAGADADGCWDNDECPSNLWERTDARIAVVINVSRQIEGLDVSVRLHNVDDATPLKVIRKLVPAGGEAEFARSVARAVEDALPLLPTRKPVDGPVFVLEDEVIPDPDEPRRPTRAADPDERPDPDERRDPPRDPVVPRATEKDPATRRAPRSPTEARVGPDEERRRMGIPAPAYARYEASGVGREEWLEKARVRAGHAFLELASGWGLGDVDRGYGVRLRISEADPVFDTVGTSSWEGAGPGSAPAFGFAVGYAPAWFLDTSVTLAVQYGGKHLNTGWECPAGCDPETDETPFETVSAIQGLVEPRIRLYPVATGPVKPYAIVAFSLLLHDGFDVPDPDFVDYPNAPAGAAFGPTAGLGIAVDPISRVTIFAEVPGTWLLAPGPHAVDDGEVTLVPGQLESSGFYVRFVGGLGVRL